MDEFRRELLLEQFGPRPSRTAPLECRPADGGPDTDIACARRRRVLCEALDEPVASGGFGRRAAA